MHRIEKTKLLHDRLESYDKKYSLKRRKLRDNLNISEKVLVLPERIKKKSAPGKFYKHSVQNISYFNKEKTFLIRKKNEYLIKLPIIGLEMPKQIEKFQKASK